ncbi:hypothetical protein HIM_09304 [Hirsutella minnesotensis 3608]|uniref:Uncharacterized protein n=1 Tax=Hirsutella minnesotensis 3608 TaxID=1043627 RepID=A0A0F8A366_9HYPO|nr:hypothetical protein HIM_09304 [Hirsutella minnesotensis 3608]
MPTPPTKQKFTFPVIGGSPSQAGKPNAATKPQDQPFTIEIERDNITQCDTGLLLMSEINAKCYAFAEVGMITNRSWTVDLLMKPWPLYERCFSPSDLDTSWRIKDPAPAKLNPEKTPPVRIMNPMPPLSPTANVQHCTGTGYLDNLRKSSSLVKEAEKITAEDGVPFATWARQLAQPGFYSIRSCLCIIVLKLLSWTSVMHFVLASGLAQPPTNASVEFLSSPSNIIRPDAKLLDFDQSYPTASPPQRNSKIYCTRYSSLKFAWKQDDTDI